MKMWMRVAALMVAAVLLAGCIVDGEVVVGSGAKVTKDYDFSEFSRVAVGNAFRVDIQQGDSYSVSVTVDDNLAEYLDVQQNGDQVRIYLKPRLMLGLRDVTLEAKITMPAITGLDFSGATRATVTGFEGADALDIEVSGASRLTGDVVAGETELEVSGASTVELDGRASGLQVAASGASTARLEDFETTNARVNASGASRITVNATGEIRGDASGASTVEYLGDPESVRVDTSGASNVRSR